MPQGLQIWRGDGKLIFDASRSLCRVLGNIDLTEAKGKVYCDDKRKWASVNANGHQFIGYQMNKRTRLN